MLEFKIQLTRVGSYTKFVETMNKVHGSVMIIGKNRRINAKSLLGVINTPKTEVLTLQMDCEESDITEIRDYINRCCVPNEGEGGTHGVHNNNG